MAQCSETPTWRRAARNPKLERAKPRAVRAMTYKPTTSSSSPLGSKSLSLGFPNPPEISSRSCVSFSEVRVAATSSPSPPFTLPTVRIAGLPGWQLNVGSKRRSQMNDGRAVIWHPIRQRRDEPIFPATPIDLVADYVTVSRLAPTYSPVLALQHCFPSL